MIQPVLLIVLPLLIAFISIFNKKSIKYLLIIGSLINVGILPFIKEGEYYIGGYKPPYGISLYVDYYAFICLVVLNILFALLIIFSYHKLKGLGSILLITNAALNGLILTGDLFNLFVFLEIASISAYIISSSNKKIIYSFNYMVMAVLGGSMYLFGLALLYSQYGTLNMATMHSLILTSPPASHIPVIMIFVGLAIEVKLIPFNAWVKGVLQNSDELVGPLIGSIYSGVMLVVFDRLFSDVLVINDKGTVTLTIFAVITIIAGEVMAFGSTRIRQVLLYSSIAQSGLAVVLILNGFSTVALLVIFGNTIAKFIMFSIAGFMSSGTGTDELNAISGIFAKKILNGISFTIAGLSVIGLPLFFGFFIKLNVLYNLFMAHEYILPGILLITSLIEGSYIIRMLVTLWNPGKEGEDSSENDVTTLNYPIKRFVCIITLIMSLGLVALGIMPNYATSVTEQARKNSIHENMLYTLNAKGVNK